MVERQVEETSETTLDHACNSSIFLLVQLILMFKGGQLSRVIDPSAMTMFCYMWMKHWVSVKMQNLF